MLLKDFVKFFLPIDHYVNPFLIDKINALSHILYDYRSKSTADWQEDTLQNACSGDTFCDVE